MSIGLSRRERASLRRIVPLLGVDWRRFALACVLGAAGLGASVALGATSAWLIARASQMPPVLHLNTAVVAVRFFGISKALLRYLERLASHHVALSGMSRLRTAIYSGLAARDGAAVWSLRRGDLLERVGTDVDAIGDMVVKSLLPFALAAIIAVTTSAGIALIDPASGLVLFVCLVISGVIAPLLVMRSARLSEAARRLARTEVSATSMRILDHADELSIDGRLHQAFDDLDRDEDVLARATNRAAWPAGWAGAVDVAALMCALIAATWFGIVGVGGHDVSHVALAVLALTPLATFEATAQLGPAAIALIRAAEAAERIGDLLDRGDDVVVERIHVDEAAPRLEARDLAVGWPGGPTLLSGITLSLEPGRALGIVGPSGIGKTTLLYTLAGMIPPHAGTLTLGGHDVWRLERARAAASISLTTEDAHIFDTSVIENLRVARGDLTQTDALAVIEQAGLGTWVNGLARGLDEPVTAGARTISGGERRRLLLGRALASPAPLMLVDEPGEHLDPELADSLIADLLVPAHSGERGVIVVTHRLSGLGAADEILVVGPTSHGARIIARGAHADLARTHAAYADALAQESL
ncbi:thiol reductant ABC exporter subunit CydC [Nanchangia anserum]|uniref:Thiol reductant ABC exporter subunit CydC n=1 Tax=Nanchangia anserum TaxID=2692125 RepID=A0A8I0KPC0_9ACTO|nr:thiol reductant ABC exporter subunit CydC [Nanchangia anserum]MBD3690201.1 thiol reductant ABC exporter subunit CydC [Nanchangia anserum]QOX82347.1 thiol reductant ABC exporter subunit CydC [Nanchangia anserum]